MYDLINVKSRNNTKKTNKIIILLIIFAIFISFFVPKNKKNNVDESKFLQVASYDFSFQIEAEKRKKQKEKIDEISTLEGFSEEQMPAFLA